MSTEADDTTRTAALWSAACHMVRSARMWRVELHTPGPNRDDLHALALIEMHAESMGMADKMHRWVEAAYSA